MIEDGGYQRCDTLQYVLEAATGWEWLIYICVYSFRSMLVSFLKGWFPPIFVPFLKG